MRGALAASGAELVTVALRRADLSGGRDPFANILEFIDPDKFLLLPNTSGAITAEEAVRLARLAVEDVSTNADNLKLWLADAETVRRAIAELSVEFREVSVSREMEGFSYKEITDLADVPIGTVMSRLARARKQSQKRFAGELPGPLYFPDNNRVTQSAARERDNNRKLLQAVS